MLTHCNAGALATAGDYGTALGVIRGARDAGKRVAVIADETRPFLQGLRLTAWELAKDNIPVTVITDGMAGHVMKGGKSRCVVVGADRIAANGDTANKIGTYMVAVLARENDIPFYVAAPITTLDLSLPQVSRFRLKNAIPVKLLISAVISSGRTVSLSIIRRSMSRRTNLLRRSLRIEVSRGALRGEFASN